jgi:hypothetical protein
MGRSQDNSSSDQHLAGRPGPGNGGLLLQVLCARLGIQPRLLLRVHQLCKLLRRQTTAAYKERPFGQGVGKDKVKLTLTPMQVSCMPRQLSRDMLLLHHLPYKFPREEHMQVCFSTFDTTLGQVLCSAKSCRSHEVRPNMHSRQHLHCHCWAMAAAHIDEDTRQSLQFVSVRRVFVRRQGPWRDKGVGQLRHGAHPHQFRRHDELHKAAEGFTRPMMGATESSLPMPAVHRPLWLIEHCYHHIGSNLLPSLGLI